ncbi:MAG: universal stress protein [Propionibacteriaceae bacterium]
MNHTGRTPLVAVGVDGTTEADEAAHYAAAVARDRGWDLMAVYCYQIPPATAGMSAQFVTRTLEDAETLVNDVLSGLRLGTRTRVQRMVTAASPIAALRDASRIAALLVLGRHHFNLSDQLLTGRVGSAVAAGANCPVVVVPPGWIRTDAVGRSVVVALDVESPAESTLRCAFEEAEWRQADVVAMHAIPIYGEGSFFSEERASLGAVLAGAKQDHPDVEVRTLLVSGDPPVRIVEESVVARLMVVGRPHHGHHLGSWSRSVARAVMDRSLCPLLIAPPVPATGRDEALSGSSSPGLRAVAPGI